MKNVQISASILSSDMTRMAEVAKTLEESRVDMLHFDVMDGVFVPNLTFGMPVLAALDQHTSLFMDVHLMIADPLRYVPEFVKAGADLITFHLESNSDPIQTITAIRSAGIQAGIVIKPNTAYEAVLPYLPMVDVVLVMTVEPGFGGQSFQPEMLKKVEALRTYILNHNLHTIIEVDGGINPETGTAAAKAGAELLVVGSYLFRQPDMGATVAELKQLTVQE